MTRRCTCGIPPSVDLTEHINGVDMSDPSASREQLFTNLEQFGWSPILIPVASFGRTVSHEANELLRLYSQWNELHPAMFTGESTEPLFTALSVGNASSTGTSNRAIETESRHCTYIASESGSSNHTEAKQSWEFTWNPDPTSDTSSVAVPHVPTRTTQRCLHGWAELLRAVARLVQTTLHLPKDVIVDKSHTETKCIDVLRAFSYDAVPDTANTAMGSSPHTDWGTLTVIWQDDTPDCCLQTYCHLHDTWNDVNVERPDESHLSLVVHVGDMLSVSVFGIWPSPRHRVLAPVTQRRHSLVYFAYPPAGTTLDRLSRALEPWRRRYLDSHDTSQVLVQYADYSLLHNQSAAAAQDSLSHDALCSLVRRRFLECRHRPVEEILRDKWRQVQR